MYYNLIFIYLIFNIIFSSIEIGGYVWPSEASETITDVFGDKRSRRFHAGIDVRTYGEIGHKLFAIESGYVSRISISPNGYGKALYLKLNDGNTAVYAHLDTYTEKLNSYIDNYKNNNNVNFFDIYLKKNDFKFKKGEVIGYAGDTGSLSGGHLHFEIRDENNKPINPLQKYYKIHDTKKPIPNSLAFIPIDTSAYINGKQDYAIYDLIKYDESQYIIKDTVSIIGNFGIGVNVIDEINNQPFNYGIYNIEAFINGKEIYNITFDEYDMKHNHLIYNELDYNLLINKGEKFHRLYINNNEKLDFINNNSVKLLNLDEGFHDLLINIKDNNHNKISIHGIIKGDIIFNKKINLKNNNNRLYLNIDEGNLDKYNFYLTNRYENGTKSPLNYTVIDSSTYYIDKTPPPFNVIEYYMKNNGIKSVSKYLSFDKIDSKNINGIFNIRYLDNGASIQFQEDYFSGHDYYMKIIKKNNEEFYLDTYRISKTIITSKLLSYSQFNEISKIVFIYKTNPHIEFSKEITGKYIPNKTTTNFIYNNFIIKTNHESFYNDIFITIEDTNIVTENYKLINSPIIFKPNNIPFKNKVQIHYEEFSNDEENFGLYKHNGKKWIFQNINNNQNIKYNTYSGGVFAILSEKKAPVVKNIIPGKNGTYKQKDLKDITFNCDDVLSGVNPESIKIYLDKKQLYFDYIKFRKLVKSNLIGQLSIGEHLLEMHISDNLNNSKIISHNFYIK